MFNTLQFAVCDMSGDSVAQQRLMSRSFITVEVVITDAYEWRSKKAA